MSSGIVQYGVGLGLVGQPDPQSLTGTAATQTLSIQPASGEIWIVACLYGFHDDNAGNHTLQWVGYDGSTQVILNAGSSIAQLVETQLYSAVPCPLPLWITNATYLQLYSTDAIPAGKKLYARGLIYKVRGIEAWSNI